MKSTAALAVFSVASFVLLAGCNTRVRYGEDSPLVGKPAPSIEGKTVDGTAFSLKEKYADNVVLVDFWATWCGPCVMELPILLKVAEDYKDRGVVLVTVNAGEDAEKIQAFQKELEAKFNVVLDPDGKHASAYQVSGIPQLVVIGRGGIVEELHVGLAG
jgi:thiol-disulfide isomerase/thioredoxin